VDFSKAGRNKLEGGKKFRRTALPPEDKFLGGKRPRTATTPLILLKDNKPYLALGSPGGTSIPGTSSASPFLLLSSFLLSFFLLLSFSSSFPSSFPPPFLLPYLALGSPGGTSIPGTSSASPFLLLLPSSLPPSLSRPPKLNSSILSSTPKKKQNLNPGTPPIP
jgi:hypothetical protein